MPNDKHSCPSAASPRNFGRCGYVTSDGRRCRMLCSGSHPTLCPFHARDEQEFLESRRLGAELAASLTGRFMTAPDINFVLGKLFTAIAQNRIPRRTGATLAWIGQLMLHSLPRIDTQFCFKYGPKDWQRFLDNAPQLSGSNPASFSDSQPGPDADSGPDPDPDPNPDTSDTEASDSDTSDSNANLDSSETVVSKSS